MTKGNTQNLAAMLEAAYPVASNTKNTYARNYMLKTLVDQAHWPMNTKLGDAADKTSQVQAYLGETVATESEVSGKVVRQQVQCTMMRIKSQISFVSQNVMKRKLKCTKHSLTDWLQHINKLLARYTSRKVTSTRRCNQKTKLPHLRQPSG